MTPLYTKRFTPWSTESIPSSSSSSTTTIASRSSEYKLSKCPIGEGSYSVVYACKNKYNGHRYAAKKYNKGLTYGLESLLQGEFEILSQVSMSHLHILSLFDYFETSHSFYFVTDLAEGGDLFNKIVYDSPSGKLDITISKEIVTQLVSAVSFLHSNSIIHRDIKPENILFPSKESNDILLGDFGLARVLKPQQRLHDVSGTLSYMAPEMFNREVGYSFPVDVWAIGVSLCFMLSGYLPFDCETDDETKDAIVNKKYLFVPQDYWIDIPESAKNFILSCFETNPEQRPSSKELGKHDFLYNDTARSIGGKDGTSSSTFAAQKAEIHQIFQKVSKQDQTRKDISNLNSPVIYHEMDDDVVARGAFCLTPECVTELSTPITSTCPSREQSWLQLKKSKDNMSNNAEGGLRVAECHNRSPAKFSI
ncbi:cmk1 [Candida margitis]|uniref:cmk1 n=1 Tax=Candida margitis TaxID=1775924 RepID=UPI00222608DA|nr:cmk1 [Candida margitis]KAI5959961.1 cmk1 [Candida margitis]